MFNPDPKPKKKPKNRPAIPPEIVIEVLERDQYTCQYCGKLFPEDVHQLHCHHRIFKGMGKTPKSFDALDNLALCCWECHSDHANLKHARILSESNDDKINELEMRYSDHQFKIDMMRW